MATLRCLFNCLGRSLAVFFICLILLYLAVALVYALWLMRQGGAVGECLILSLAWPAMAIAVWAMAKSG